MANIFESIVEMPLKNKAILLAVLVIAIASIVLLVSWSEKADMSFQTMVEVRNRLLSAYEEVMRMQI